MVRHIILWNFAEGFSDGENARNAEKVKSLLEALPAVIPGIVSLRVFTGPVVSGNRDVLLDSVFTDAAALAAYTGHPAHVEVGRFVRSVLTNRACIDFEESDFAK